ncbi:unnamed protein product [Mytilus edulis]|uniref:Uncharacterized protein n=1 Tax=Mytilus edulis TaxID=6550 RepID=A0A8S3TAA0_MYTED|nr:unnamed protein product [Mytilus edulis]
MASKSKPDHKPTVTPAMASMPVSTRQTINQQCHPSQYQTMNQQCHPSQYLTINQQLPLQWHPSKSVPDHEQAMASNLTRLQTTEQSTHEYTHPFHQQLCLIVTHNSAASLQTQSAKQSTQNSMITKCKGLDLREQQFLLSAKQGCASATVHN